MTNALLSPISTTRISPQLATAVTLDRVRAHFTEKVWTQTGLVVMPCDAANRCGVINPLGDVTVEPDEVAANAKRTPHPSYEIRKCYARLNTTFDDGEQHLYFVPGTRNTAEKIAALIGEAILWGNATGAVVLWPDDTPHENMDLALHPDSLIAWIAEWRRRTSRPVRVRAIEWCCTGPGDFRAWHRMLAEASHAQ